MTAQTIIIEINTQQMKRIVENAERRRDMLKAIETVYNGYRFRSRLEARWAVFFDTLGIKYEYEKEGYDLGDAGWYLPDFWLPEQRYWIEIKGQRPTQKELDLIFSLDTSWEEDVTVAKRSFLFYGDVWLPEELYNKNDNESAYTHGDMLHWWCECTICGMLGIEFLGYSDRLSCRHQENKTSGPNTPRLMKAYTAARQARFER